MEKCAHPKEFFNVFTKEKGDVDMRLKNRFFALPKLNKWSVVALVALLLVANLTMMGISFARYRTSYESQNQIGVIGFSPALEDNTFEGDFEVPGTKSFAVTNTNGDVGLELTVTVETKGVLPLSYRLFMGEEELTLVWNAEDNAYVATGIPMPVGTERLDFKLQSDWSAGYEEYFGGLVEDIKIRVLCEQVKGE